MTASGTYAVYHGAEYAVRASGRGYVLLDLSGVGRGAFADEDLLGQTAGARDDRVKIKESALERLLAREVSATWRGAEVYLEGLADAEHVWYYTNAGPAWAAANGAKGSQHDGWRGSTPLAELTHVRVEEKDLPVRRDG
ncbi:hypothetical protein [Motilibacter deserti]|uniref:Uncharacterized protein n=1 Tax=Motilibacter deserti TaxID=2714956 RepID=A0ABX0GQ27_9ACTN|nr:hypothetical protein [Motilibacter deserti]NHC12934.1 hypothetical protein [Motilibacter deserti]